MRLAMDDINTSNPEVNKENNTGCAKGYLTAVLGIIGFIIVCILAIQIVDHIPRNIDIQLNGNYTIELKATSSPDWPFGSQDGRIVLKGNNKTISSVDFQLRNDGKGMGDYNWTVDWKNDKVIVTIIGEEQKDEVYYIYYNGETTNITSDLS